MDPNLFHIDWERTLEAIVGIIILSFLVERVAALVFESRWFVRSTKVPALESEEAKRERAGVAVANGILAAGDDAAKLQKAVAGLTPDNPLWPHDSGHPDETPAKAQALLARVTALQQRRQRLAGTPIKEIGAFVLGAGVCVALKFDALSIILLQPATTYWGAILTGAVVAGGSKASIRLFQDLLGVKSQALQQVRNPPKPEPKP